MLLGPSSSATPSSAELENSVFAESSSVELPLLLEEVRRL